MNVSAESRARGKVWWRIILPLFLVSMIAFVDRVNIGYAALTMNADLGFSSEVFGFGAGIFFAGYFLFEIPGALIAERFGPRLWLARILISWGLVSALMAFMHTKWQFYLLRFLLGAAEASLYPVIYASCIPRWFAPAERARAIAVLLASLQMAGIVGAPLAGWLLETPVFGLAGWRALFLIESIPAIVLGVALIYWLVDWPREARWLNAEERQAMNERYERDAAAMSAVRRFTVGQAIGDPEVLKLALTYFLWITGYWGFNYWMPTIFRQLTGWTTLAIGQWVALALMVSLLASLYIGHSSSRRDEKRWHGAAPMFLAALSMAASAYVHAPWLYFLLLVLTAIGVYAPMSVWWSYPTTFLSGAAAAGAIGLINSFGNLGGFVGPYVTGALRERTGNFTGAMVYLAASVAVAGGLILTLRRTSAPCEGDRRA